MTDLTILADENIPFARDAFGTMGTVRLKHGRQISRDDLGDVDMLVVRSITRVDAALLSGTRVRFVGTATSGSDHVAIHELDQLGIECYTALGCNANAVAEYMATAWLTVARRKGRALSGLHVGIVGVGHVGSLVADRASALGMTPVLNDPPKARESGSTVYRPLNDLLDCDIVTCHTPLTVDGPDPTYRLMGERFLTKLKPGAWFCSAGRGEVIDETALRESIDRGQTGAVILDVWDHEPAIDETLLTKADIGTPHIAGYSLEGKLNGTAMVYEAACRFFGIKPSWDAHEAAPPAAVPHVVLAAKGRPEFEVLAEAVTAVYPIQRDSDALRRAVDMTAADRAQLFDELRKTYPVRREFRQTAVAVQGGSDAVNAALRALQFQVA